MIELSIVLTIVGILLGAGLLIINPIVEGLRQLETKEKLAKVEKILNIYAINNYRLPCPAIPDRTPGVGEPPYGFESGSGVNGNGIATICNAANNALREGIVPFNTLGIPEEFVIDGWNNHFTYAISPAFGQDTLGTPPVPANVHAACRTRDWMYETGLDADSNPVFANRVPPKARFCCPGTPAPDDANDGDLIVNDRAGNFVLAMARQDGSDNADVPDELMDPVDPNDLGSAPGTRATINFGNPAYFEAPQVPPADERATAVAYILVSHGPNGRGAFTAIAAGDRNPMPGGGDPENENVNADDTFIDQTLKDDAGAGINYDDIVIWRTQDMIFAAEGESCTVP